MLFHKLVQAFNDIAAECDIGIDRQMILGGIERSLERNIVTSTEAEVSSVPKVVGMIFLHESAQSIRGGIVDYDSADGFGIHGDAIEDCRQFSGIAIVRDYGCGNFSFASIDHILGTSSSRGGDLQKGSSSVTL